MGRRGRVKGRILLPTGLPFNVDTWLAIHELPLVGARLFRWMCASDPVANPHSGSDSVGGHWVSTKMRRTIGFESHTNEARACLLYDWTARVLGYFDRAVSLGVKVPDRLGRRSPRPYIPDFFVVEVEGAFFDEWKTEEWLGSHRESGATRYTFDGTRWRCLGAEAAAARYGFGYRVRTDAEHLSADGGSELGNNLEILRNYLDPEAFMPDPAVCARIVALVRAHPGISIAALRLELE